MPLATRPVREKDIVSRSTPPGETTTLARLCQRGRADAGRGMCTPDVSHRVLIEDLVVPSHPLMVVFPSYPTKSESLLAGDQFGQPRIRVPKMRPSSQTRIHPGAAGGLFSWRSYFHGKRGVCHKALDPLVP